MFRRSPNIDQLQVIRPCTASWDDMTGDDRARFCARCQTTVFNTAAMTRAEIERLVRERNGRFCSRIVRLPDGRIETKADLHSLRFRFSRWLAGLAFAASTLMAAEQGLRIRVLDPTGAGIGSAEVAIKNARSGIVRDAKTNDDGELHVTDLPPGDYEVQIHSTGFFTYRTQTKISESQQAPTPLSVTLRVGTVGGSDLLPYADVPSIPAKLNNTDPPPVKVPEPKPKRRFLWFRF